MCHGKAYVKQMNHVPSQGWEIESQGYGKLGIAEDSIHIKRVEIQLI